MNALIHILEDVDLNWSQIDTVIEEFNNRPATAFTYTVAQSSRIALRNPTRFDERKQELVNLRRVEPVVLICDIRMTELPEISPQDIKKMGIASEFFTSEANGLLLLHSATSSCAWEGLIAIASHLVAPNGFASIRSAFDSSARWHWLHVGGGLSSWKACATMLTQILEHFEEIYSAPSVRCYPKSSEGWFR